MPRNEGIVPPAARVDIKYRCGQVVRDVDPRERRWSIDDPEFGAGYAYDIAWWQPAGKGKVVNG